MAVNNFSFSVPVTSIPNVPSGVTNPSRCTACRKLAAKTPKALTSNQRVQRFGLFKSSLAGKGNPGPNGFRTARTPHSAAACNMGRNTLGKVCVCLCVSTCDTHMPAACTLRICAAASAAISEASSCLANARAANIFRPSGNRPNLVNEGSLAGGSTGSPLINTTWQPTLRFGTCVASSLTSRNALPFAINVADVTTPFVCALTMPRFTPGVNPKSSALTMRRRTQPV